MTAVSEWAGTNIFLNPFSFLELWRKDRCLLNSEHVRVHYDGMSLVWLARLMGDRGRARVSFDDTSIAPAVFSSCVRDQARVALIGSADGVAQAAATLLRRKYVGLNIAFVQSGFFSSADESGVLDFAQECDVVVCAMGSPRQERLLHNLRERGWGGVGFTCGGYLDQLVSAHGSVYYPRFMDKMNLRWLYRIIREPRRLIPRYAVDYPVGMSIFVCSQLTQLVGRIRLGPIAND